MSCDLCNTVNLQLESFSVLVCLFYLAVKKKKKSLKFIWIEILSSVIKKESTLNLLSIYTTKVIGNILFLYLSNFTFTKLIELA